jgi:hypothetical protein
MDDLRILQWNQKRNHDSDPMQKHAENPGASIHIPLSIHDAETYEITARMTIRDGVSHLLPEFEKC